MRLSLTATKHWLHNAGQIWPPVQSSYCTGYAAPLNAAILRRLATSIPYDGHTVGQQAYYYDRRGAGLRAYACAMPVRSASIRARRNDEPRDLPL